MERLKLSKPRVIFVKYDLFPQVRSFTIDSYTEKGEPCSSTMTCWKPTSVIYNMDAEEAKPYVEALESAIAEQRKRHKEINEEIKAKLYEKCWFLKPSEGGNG